MKRLIVLLPLLLLVASPSLAAQGPTGPQKPWVNPFNPDSFNPQPDDGGGGGGGSTDDPVLPGLPTPPGDAGTPPAPFTPAAPAPGVRGASGRLSGSGQAGTTLVPDSRSISGSVSGGLVVDRWETWWETNKFDFISLHRLEDLPSSTQGNLDETSTERLRRLRRVRELLRGQVTPIVHQLTGADDPAVRASAIVALGKLGGDEMVDRATSLLRDGSFEVRRSAMLALGVLDNARASYLLMNIAADSSSGRKLMGSSGVTSEERGTALLAATLRDGISARNLLQLLLDERDDLPLQVLAAACDAAGLLGDARLLKPLAELARDTKLPEYVRSSATTALGRLGESAAVPTLLELLDSRQEPRRAAAAALGYVAHDGMHHVITRLARVLKEETDGPTRHFAAISLGRLGGPAARRALLESFSDPSSDMRPWLALALGLCERRNPDGTLTPLLLERAAKEKNLETRSAYLIALGLTRDPRALDILSEELEKGPTLSAGQAALALGLSGQPGALAPLRNSLETQNNPTVLRQAALGLGVLGDGAAIPDLLELVRTTSNPYVASFASLGIAFMGDEDAIGPLLETIEKQGPRGVTTSFATAAIGQLFDEDRRPALSRLAAGDNYLARPDATSRLLALGF
ncbi:MAG: hypothetical protein DHS20C15_24730 [Planctomycetota bacterium]|nr:MAG: hypothetical protein DHS20C15_24730 [Planctomycetota bacterium]